MAKTILNGAVIRDKMTKEVLTCVGNGIAENKDGAQVTLKDDVFYTVLKEGNDTDVPEGYSIVNGVLLKDVVAATQQGALVLRDILKAVPGHLLVSAQPLHKGDGKMDIFSYTPASDEFKKLAGDVAEKETVITDVADDLFIFQTIRTSKITVEKEDENEPDVYTGVDGARMNLYSATKNEIVSYTDTFLKGSTLLADPTPTLVCVSPVSGEDFSRVTVVFTSHRELSSIDDEDYTHIIKESEDVGIKGFSIIIELESNTDPYFKANPSFNCHVSHEFSLHGVKDIDSITETDNGSLLVKGGNVIYYTNDNNGRRKVINAPEVAETAGFDYLLDCEVKNNCLTFTLGNKEYETCVIKSEKTDDRGPVVTVTKIG